MYTTDLKKNMKTAMLLQVHDELLLEAPVCEKDKAMALLKEEMERAARLSVKLTADVHCGNDWVEAK